MSVNSLQKKSQNSRRLIRFITVSAILLAALSVPAGSGAGAKDKVGRLPKDSVASNQLRTLDGRSFSLSDLRGQVVVLDFFAIWCGHSKQHIPTMTRFNNEDNKRGLQIIGLAVRMETRLQIGSRSLSGIMESTIQLAWSGTRNSSATSIRAMSRFLRRWSMLAMAAWSPISEATTITSPRN
ncbi:MAG: TlpA family protein disulfide reductase [Acidobacteria bacterium]|nr:TlpA family protein disulfide reductase [Acidobacteriota bacterium]